MTPKCAMVEVLTSLGTTSIASTLCARGGMRATSHLRVCLAEQTIALRSQRGGELALVSGSAMVMIHLLMRSLISAWRLSTSGSGGGSAAPSAAQMEHTLWRCSSAGTWVWHRREIRNRSWQKLNHRICNYPGLLVSCGDSLTLVMSVGCARLWRAQPTLITNSLRAATGSKESRKEETWVVTKTKQVPSLFLSK